VKNFHMTAHASQALDEMPFELVPLRHLARIDRVSKMRELAASLAHEIKQPIARVSLNAETSLQWIRREPPGLEQAGRALSRIINDAKRPASIVDRNRSLYGRGEPRREPIACR
jgi:signal transduction histidine kinase